MLTVMEEHPLKCNAGMFFRLSVEVEGALAVLIVMVLLLLSVEASILAFSSGGSLASAFGMSPLVAAFRTVDNASF